MNERLFQRLSERLREDAVVLASIVASRGAVPRKPGSRMLVTRHDSEFSVGGGLAEARVIAAARALLDDPNATTELRIELNGGADAAGVCGGTLWLCLRRWHGDTDRDRAEQVAANLRDGHAVPLSADDLGPSAPADIALPNDRLLIIGAGHCGQALFELSRLLDFDIWVFDQRPDCFNAGQFAGATCRHGEFSELRSALNSERAVYAVLLNRDYASDIATLRVLCERPPHFVGMMGSQRRIAEVARALPALPERLPRLQAPVGLELGAETPHEIAVSILAQLVAERRRQTPGVN